MEVSKIPEVVNIVSDSEVGVFPIYFYCMGLNEDIEPFIGKNMSVVLVELDNGNMRWCTSLSEWKEFGRTAFRKIQGEEGYFKRVYDAVVSHSEAMVKAAEQSHFGNLSDKSTDGLWQIYASFGHKMRLLVASGLVFSYIDAKTNLLSDKLLSFLRTRLPEKEVPRAFTILSTPPEDSFVKKERESLVALALGVKNRFKRYHELSGPELLLLIQKDSRLNKQFEEHFGQFFWLNYNYSGPAWTRGEVCSFIIEHANQRESLEKQLKGLRQEKETIRQKQNAIEKELKLDKEHDFLFRVARDVVYLKGFRKDMMYKAYCYMENLLKEIAKRGNLSLQETRFLLPSEVKELLETGKADKELLKERQRFCVIVGLNKKYAVFTGEKARKASERIIEEKVQEKQELRGSCACHGEAKGIVKIINAVSDLAKMNKGNILVSKQTNPNLVPAMEKAAAIITDIGGITCHAAIVARELRIPCVIGTGNATKILKDGDAVEVNASKGIVRLIE